MDIKALAKKYWPFLSLLLLFLVSLRVTDSTYGPLIYWVLAFLLVFAFLMAKKNPIKFHEITADLIYFVSLLIIIFFTSFNQAVNSGNAMNVLISLLLFIGLICFYLLGFLLRDYKLIKPKYVYLTIILGLGVLVLIGFIANCATYPFMYQAFYSDYVYFYDGIRHTIGNESQFLYGLSITAVQTDYALAPAVLLASSTGIFLFYKYKNENLPLIIIHGVCALIGWLFILGVGKASIFTYLTIFLLLALCVIYRFVRPVKEVHPLIRIFAWAFYLLVLIFIIIVFANAIFQFPAFASNAVLNKIFNNSFLLGINQSIAATFSNALTVFFGSSISSHFSYGSDTLYVSSINNSSFEFELLLEGGLIAFFALLVFIPFLVSALRRYFVEDEIKAEKAGLVLLVTAMFVYYSFNYVSLPTDVARHMSSLYNLLGYNNSLILLVALFLMGYTYTMRPIPGAVLDEEEETETISNVVEQEMNVEASINE